MNRRVTTPHTLTAVTVKVTGKIKFEDLDEKYTQQVSKFSNDTYAPDGPTT